MTDNQQEFTEFSLERQTGQIPDGIHTFRIFDAEERIGAESGMKYISITLKCETEELWDGQLVWSAISLSKAARFKMDEFLDAVDAPTSGKATFEKFLGAYVKAQVAVKTYTKHDGTQGEKVEVLKWLPVSHKESSGIQKPSLTELAKKKKKKSKLPDDVLEDE